MLKIDFALEDGHFRMPLRDLSGKLRPPGVHEIRSFSSLGGARRVLLTTDMASRAGYATDPRDECRRWTEVDMVDFSFRIYNDLLSISGLRYGVWMSSVCFHDIFFTSRTSEMACTRQRRQISQPSRSHDTCDVASRLDMPKLIIGPGDQLASCLRHRGGSVEARSPNPQSSELSVSFSDFSDFLSSLFCLVEMLQLGAKDPLRLLQSRLPRLLLVVQPLDVGQEFVEGFVGQAIPSLAELSGAYLNLLKVNLKST